MHCFLLVMKESTCIRERGKKNWDNQRQRSQTDVLGTGHTIFPPVRITAGNSLTRLHFLLHPWPTEWVLEMAKQHIHSALFVWFIGGIGICKSMFLISGLSEHSKNQTELCECFLNYLPRRQSLQTGAIFVTQPAGVIVITELVAKIEIGCPVLWRNYHRNAFRIRKQMT